MAVSTKNKTASPPQWFRYNFNRNEAAILHNDLNSSNSSNNHSNNNNSSNNSGSNSYQLNRVDFALACEFLRENVIGFSATTKTPFGKI